MSLPLAKPADYRLSRNHRGNGCALPAMRVAIEAFIDTVPHID